MHIRIILEEGLAPGFAANTAAVLALSLGKAFPELLDRDLKDKESSLHRGITNTALPILMLEAAAMKNFRQEALQCSDLQLWDFNETAQKSRSYDEYAQKLLGQSAETLHFLGLALAGPEKSIKKLCGSLKLYK